VEMHRTQRRLQEHSVKRLRRHLKEVLQRCQRSVCVRAYFDHFPLKEF